MKEFSQLSIEQKAKAYDEAKLRMRIAFNSKRCTINFMNEIFPELKESEDERIRKELIGFLRNIPNSNYTCEEMALWLEKQGVQPHYNIGDVICDKSCTTLNKEAQPNMAIVDIQNGMYICDKGSFPVSQQDEYVLVGKRIDTKLNDDSVSNELRASSIKHAEKEIKKPTCPDNEEFELIYTFEKGAKWNAAQKSTWSEEDEVIIDEIIYFLENGTVKLQHDLSLYASWLKSLRDRYLKNTWKPSDEQMEALLSEVNAWTKGCPKQKILKSLYQDLKKLK